MKKFLPALFSILIAFSSCHPPRYIYSPAPPNNPYFRQKGELKVAAYYSTSGSENKTENEYDNGFDLQSAYALSDHWALTADYYKRNEKQVEVDADEPFFQKATIRYNRKITSVGAGYFMPVNSRKTVMFNAFGGIGFGRFSFIDYGLSNNADYYRNYTNDIVKWYIQPSLNFFPTNYFRTGLTTKLSWVHYRNAITNYTQPEIDYLDLDVLERKTLSFFELTLNYQVTLEKLPWVYLDGAVTLCPEAANGNANLETRNFNASIGLSFDLSKLKKNK